MPPETATKKDIERLYDKIEPMSVNIAVILTKLEDMPEMPARPCTFHTELKEDVDAHISEHKENVRTWRQPVIRALVDMAKIAIVFLMAFFMLRESAT